MAIDIIFIIMVAYGFYFGYAYGLIKVVIFVLSLIVALGISMYITPTTTQLMQETLVVESPLLPFVAFVVTLVGVMLIARIVFKLLQETVKSKQVNQVTQGIGGLLMAAVFVFLFSVLVTFFSAAHVIRPEKARTSSNFYFIIEKIPVHASDILKAIMPFMEKFTDYMEDALERLENGKTRKEKQQEDINDLFSDDDFALDSMDYQVDTNGVDTSLFYVDSLMEDIIVDTSSTTIPDTSSDFETKVTVDGQ